MSSSFHLRSPPEVQPELEHFTQQTSDLRTSPSTSLTSSPTSCVECAAVRSPGTLPTPPSTSSTPNLVLMCNSTLARTLPHPILLIPTTTPSIVRMSLGCFCTLLFSGVRILALTLRLVSIHNGSKKNPDPAAVPHWIAGPVRRQSAAVSQT